LYEGGLVDIVEKYKSIREVGMALNHKMIKSCLSKEIIFNSAKLLGIVQRDVLMFEGEEEMSVLMDFALHEYKVNNKNAVQVYQEKIGGQNEIEAEILASLLSSYTSLFKIIAISENTLLLRDVLKKEDKLIKLIEISFSKTATPGMLLFTRAVSFNDCYRTSGVSFAFRSDMEKHLIRRYGKISKKIKTGSDSMKRYISFFQLNSECGEEVIYFRVD
jgi:hypothetical protein